MYELLLTVQRGRQHRMGLPLAAVAGRWNASHVAIDRARRVLVPVGEGGQQPELAFAKIQERLRGRTNCGLLGEGDEPVTRLVDPSTRVLHRGDAYVHLVRGALLADAGDAEAAVLSLREAARCARNEHERAQIEKRISELPAPWGGR